MEDTSKKATVLIVDPPSGWRHGFPAPLQADYKQQLITAGYPKKDLGFAIKYSRYWELTVDLPDTKEANDEVVFYSEWNSMLDTLEDCCCDDWSEGGRDIAKAIKRDQELTSPYGDNNHPLKEMSDE